MKLAVYTTSTHKKFYQVLDLFEKRYLGENNPYNGDTNFFYELKEYLEEKDIPCTKMILGCNVSETSFYIHFFVGDVKIAYVVFKAEYGIIKIKDYSYSVKEFKDKIHTEVKSFLELHNQDVLAMYAAKCGIDLSNNTNEIIVVKFNDYKMSNKAMKLNGTINEIFNTYVSMNDTLRYCNGEYWRFTSKDIQELYSAFIEAYNGNFFLDNAVKRGCIID